MTDVAIEARDLAKVFDREVVAVNGLDLAIPRGTVYGLIGRNGAGKTTTLRLLMGLLRPSGGEALILGESMMKAPHEVRSRVAYVSQAQQLHVWMTLGEHCAYVSHFYEKWDPVHARSLSDHFGLAWDRQIGLMSGGEQRKAAIVLAVASRPEVLILDEPAAGLDPIARRELVDELIDVISRDEGCTVLFSTHIISDLERVAEHVGFMDRGRMVASSRLDELQGATKRVQVIFDGKGAPPGFAIPGALRSEASGPVVTAIVRVSSATQLDEIKRIPGARVNEFPLGLEDIFIELLGAEERE